MEAEARIVTSKRGVQIYDHGAPSEGLFGVVKGSYLLSYPREDGVLQPLSPLGPGFWIGDLSTFSREDGIVAMEAQRDVTAVNVPSRAIRRIIEAQPKFITEFYRLNRINTRLALRLLAATTAETTDEKIELRLSILSEYTHPDDPWLYISHQELANQMGLSVPTVKRSIQRLRDRGFIETSYARMRVIDRTVLDRQAQ